MNSSTPAARSADTIDSTSGTVIWKLIPRPRGACSSAVIQSRSTPDCSSITCAEPRVMLEQSGVDRDWITAELQAPRGRGINFQITVPDVESIVSALRAAGVELFMQPETKWYRVGEEEAGVRQFLVTDPDGYLIRFQSSLASILGTVAGRSSVGRVLALVGWNPLQPRVLVASTPEP